MVVVVIGNEVFDRVVREEFLELRVELRGERLVVGQNQRRPIDLLDDVGHREGLAGAGDAEQCLVPIAGVQPFDQLVDRLGLVSGRLDIGDDLKIRHCACPVSRRQAPCCKRRV